MTYYSKETMAFENIECLKPTTCKSCQADGCGINGECEQCLRNRAWNKEYIETHLFKCDEYFRNYHASGKHETFKKTVYRMPNEKPYLYYGIEIEVKFNEDILRVFCVDDDGYDDEETVSDDCETMLKEFTEATGGMFVYEKDGSLYNGVEFISRPTSYARWTDKDTIEKLEAGFDVLKKWGAWENQPDTNGMHVHISRKFFDYGQGDVEKQRQMYEDMDWLFQYYQNELEKIAGRKYTQYCQSKMTKIKNEYNIGAQNNGDNRWNVELEIKGKMKKGGSMASGDHYSAVSLSGPTIEGRIFKSTIDVKNVIGNIEVMRNFSHAVRNGEIVGKTLNDILHTKDNMYLDQVILNTRKECYKQNTKLKKELKEINKKIREAKAKNDQALETQIKFLESDKQIWKDKIKESEFDINRVLKDEMEIK